MRIMSTVEVEAIRSIGRDPVGRASTVGLTELDALCGSHEELRYHRGRLAMALRIIAAACDPDQAAYAREVLAQHGPTE